MNDNQSEMTANGILFDFFIVEAVKIQSISNKKIESTNYITKIKHKKTYCEPANAQTILRHFLQIKRKQTACCRCNNSCSFSY